MRGHLKNLHLSRYSFAVEGFLVHSASIFFLCATENIEANFASCVLYSSGLWTLASKVTFEFVE